jgi:hypothetical protein
LVLPCFAVEYTGSAVINSQHKFRAALVADTVPSVAYVVALFVCTRANARLEWVGAAYVATHVVGAAGYLLLVAQAAQVPVEAKALRMLAGCFAGTLAILLVHLYWPLIGAAIAVVACGELLFRVRQLRSIRQIG